MATAKKSSKRAPKKTAKKAPKKAPKKAAKKAASVALPIVAIVGATGAGVSTLARRLSGDAKFTKNRATCSVGGAKVVVWDVPGQARGECESDAELVRFDVLLDALQNAAVVVHVIDAADDEAERVGGRMNRWIYGSWHDLHKPIVTVFNKRDLPSNNAALTAVREGWRDAIELSAKSGHGVDELVARVAKLSTTPHVLAEELSTIEGSLIDLQLLLIERTKSKSFDGPSIAKTLRGWLDDETILAVHFLREGTSTYTEDGLDREDNGLLFLGSIADNLWNADTLHVVANDAERVAKELSKMGAIDVEQPRDGAVSARWNTDAIRSIAKSDAPTVQAIQLEIIRRAGYNAFRGDRVYAWLMEHPHPWRAVAFGRLRSLMREGARVTDSYTRFNTVEELADDGWNADQLWIVANDPEAAERLRHVAEVHWFADNITTLTEDEARRVAGVEAPAQVIELWWD
ncbi:MAG: GTPase [Polyangiales bacterium]